MSCTPQKNKAHSGFTLIEILIVVAIIGILSTIVIVSLREATDRTKNAKIIANITQVRKVAEELYVQEADGYTSLCNGTGGVNSSNPDLAMVETDLQNYLGASSSMTCYASNYHYCLSTRLVDDSTRWFCIDSKATDLDITQTANPCDSGEACP